MAALLLVSGIGIGGDALADVTQCAQFLGLTLLNHAEAPVKTPDKTKHGGGTRRSILSPVAPFILDHTEDPEHS